MCTYTRTTFTVKIFVKISFSQFKIDQKYPRIAYETEAMSHPPVGARGAGYGLDAELARKQAAKYDHAAEAAVRSWIEAVTGESVSGAFGASLKDGKLLCALMNKIQPGSIKRIETSIMPFKQMENISNFLKACRAVGLAEHDLFETVDLFEEKVLESVYYKFHR